MIYFTFSLKTLDVCVHYTRKKRDKATEKYMTKLELTYLHCVLHTGTFIRQVRQVIEE